MEYRRPRRPARPLTLLATSRLYLGAGCLLLALAGCRSSSTTAPPAPAAIVPPSEVDAREFAERLEQAVAGGDGNALTQAMDWDRLLDSAVSGVEASEKFRKGFLKGARETAAKSFTAGIAPAVENGATLHFLRLRTESEQVRAVFRFLHGDGGLNYFELVLDKQPGGEVRAVDAYIFASGELMTESLRRMYILAVAEFPQDAPRKMSGLQNQFIQNMDQLKQLTASFQAGDHRQALQIYDAMPLSLRQEKFALIAALQASVSIDPQRHLQIAEEYRRLFPHDASLDLITLDSLLLNNKHEEALQAIDRLDNAVGGDPYLDVMRATVVMEQDPVAAEKHTQRAIKAEPTLQAGYWAMVNATLKQRDFAATARWLTTIEERFQIEIGDLTAEPGYEEFVQSPEYRDWLSTQ